MVKVDNTFGDSLAAEMSKIIKSDKHKNMFTKNAQINTTPSEEALEYNPLAGKEHEVSSPASGAVSGVPMEERPYTPGTMSGRGGVGENMVFDPTGKVPEGELSRVMVEEKAKEVVSDPAASTEEIYVADKVLKGNPISRSELDILQMASVKLSLRKTSQKLPEIQDYPVSKSEWDRLDDEKKAFLRKKYGDPPWEKKASLLIEMVKIADALGKYGYMISEKFADKMINTFLVESGEKCECTCKNKEKCTCGAKEKKIK